MAKFSEQFIQQVAAASDIVEVISRHVALKKRGKEFVGLCPFHDDKHPSMNVSAAKQIFKCFACGAGGGVFQFLMLYEKLSFPEAVRTLARQAGIAPPPEARARPAQVGLGRDELVGVSVFAARFYRSQLRAPAGKSALSYARSRGLSDESIDRFGLGYAPAAWDALIIAARKKAFSEAQLLEIGLAVKRETGSGCYDRFRNRLMFPIIDPAGEVIAFGGRAMDENERAKYLNSPDSILFDKSRCLYALNWSREAIASCGQAIVVEGYLDALIPLQAGVNNVVATLGTALTDRHVQMLRRYGREVVLLFDADAAGAAAAERALEVFLAQQVHVRVAEIPAGKDPCDFCLAAGADALRELAAGAPDALQYLWNRRQEAYRAAGDLPRRREVLEEFLRLVVFSGAYGAIDEVRRGQLAQHIGHMLNVSAVDLQQQMRRLGRRLKRAAPAGQGAGLQQPGDPAAIAEQHLLEVLLNRPELFDTAAERVGPADFLDADLRLIAECLWDMGKMGNIALDNILSMEKMSHLGSLLTDLAAAGRRRENYDQTLEGALEHLLYRRGRQEMQELKSQGLSDEALRRLNRRLRRADPRRHPRIS